MWDKAGQGSPLLIVCGAGLGFFRATVFLQHSCSCCLCLCLCQSLFAPSPSLPQSGSWFMQVSEGFPLEFSVWWCLVAAIDMIVMVTFRLACGSLRLLRHPPHTQKAMGSNGKLAWENKIDYNFTCRLPYYILHVCCTDPSAIYTGTVDAKFYTIHVHYSIWIIHNIMHWLPS